MIYTLTLSNGKVFSELRASGSCFVSKNKVAAEDFSGGLKSVTVRPIPETPDEDAGVVQTLKACKLGRVFMVDGEYYFWLEVPTQEELGRLQDRADLDYVALMTGVEL